MGLWTMAGLLAYGICIESNGAGEEFEYLIADDYKEGKDRPDGCKVFEIAKHTWAVFPCTGPIPVCHLDSEIMEKVNEGLLISLELKAGMHNMYHT